MRQLGDRKMFYRCALISRQSKGGDAMGSYHTYIIHIIPHRTCSDASQVECTIGLIQTVVKRVKGQPSSRPHGASSCQSDSSEPGCCSATLLLSLRPVTFTTCNPSSMLDSRWVSQHTYAYSPYFGCAGTQIKQCRSA